MIKTAFLMRCAVSGFAVAISSVAAAPAFAQEARYHFDIPAQDLDSALKKFGRTTKHQLVYNGRTVRNVRSRAVKGDFTASDALSRMLQDSGLTMRAGESGVLIIAYAAAQSGNGDADKEGAAVDERGIADILVIGSKSQNTDIKRTENDAQPYRVFTQKTLRPPRP